MSEELAEDVTHVTSETGWLSKAFTPWIDVLSVQCVSWTSSRLQELRLVTCSYDISLLFDSKKHDGDWRKRQAPHRQVYKQRYIRRRQRTMQRGKQIPLHALLHDHKTLQKSCPHIKLYRAAILLVHNAVQELWGLLESNSRLHCQHQGPRSTSLTHIAHIVNSYTTLSCRNR